MRKAETFIQLQGILKPRRAVCDTEELYFHRKGRILLFDGYFNLFYIEKWKRYTNLERLYLSIRVKGFQKLLLFHDRTCVSACSLDAGCEQDYQAEFPLREYETGVFWFALVQAQKTAGQTLSGFYAGESRHCRDVALGLAVCTYHRESYVERNLKLLLSCILNQKELQVCGHLWIYLVDNGCTLHTCSPVQELTGACGGRATVIPNKNAGGAGGFTRGMLEILREKAEKQLTHVLLMDDDAMPEPDLFVRIYGFLRIRKEEWKDITMGGTMLQEEEPYLLFAAGESWQKGLIRNGNKGMDLRCFPYASHPNLLTSHFEKEHYSGWWCCCYSLDVVREDNLPLPLFLHHDDIEFGLRSRKTGIVFLNGVSVWHRNFEHTPQGSNLYYDIRNDLIEIALQYGQQRAAGYVWRFYWRRLAVRLVRGRADELFYVLKGARDFLKGPGWLWKQDPESLHKKVKCVPACRMHRLLGSAARVSWRLFRERKKTVRDYQENMYRYAAKNAWEEYLGMAGSCEPGVPYLECRKNKKYTGG